jgi:cobalt-zinc-cadmium efflux system membrane fusion protein
MNSLRIGGLVLVAAAFAVTTAISVNPVSVDAEPAKAAAPREPGILRYPADAPQLAALKINAVEELPVPLAEPLNGRVAYNENFTARVSAPIAGRIVSLRLQPAR